MIAEKLEKMQMEERAYLQALSREKFLFVQKRRERELAELVQTIKVLTAENAESEQEKTVLAAEKAESDRARAAAELKNEELLRKIEALEKQLAAK